MPIFYNTAAPTPSTKNTINSVTVDYGIRDFLLNLNLGPFYPDFSSTAVNGSPQIGQPVLDTSINGNANVVPFGLPLEQYGLFYYEMSTIQNQFQNNDGTAPTLLSIENIPATQGVFGNVDLPQGSSYPTSATDAITENGLLGKTEYAEFRKTATLFNLYVDSTKQIDMADFISLQPAGYPQQLTNYVDAYGGLDNGGPETNDLNVIGSILNGQGIGLAKSGVIPNFDIRASLAGRVLGATGVIQDTRLGTIGGQQLALALANNAAFNVQQDILGGLNVQDNILALVKGGPLPGLRPNYKITVPETGLGRAFDYTSTVLGFTIPRSYLEEAGSIFQSESNTGNIERANAMLLNTGKGQFEALVSNVFANINGTTQNDSPSTTPFRSGYVPGYARGNNDADINPTLYAFYDDKTKGTILHLLAPSVFDPNGVIPEISYNREKMIKKYGFLAPEDTFAGPRGNTGYDNRSVNDVGFTWLSVDGEVLNNNYGEGVVNFAELLIGEEEGLNPKKSLLSKTQKLFNSKGMLNIVSVKGDMDVFSSQIQTANKGGISKGSAVIRGDRFSENGSFDGNLNATAENTYCRSWTTLDRYDTVNKLVRHRGLVDTATYPYRHQLNNSVLDDNGFVKITPYKDDTSVKRYMFSIENLAWSDNFPNLIPCEQGTGDLLTGKKGRIMWFPPYDLQFNENTSVNWEKTDFIGRGESVYTYNNTERGGSLTFKMIVDHPSYVNSFAGTNGPENNYVASFFAGCVETNEYFKNLLTPSETNTIITETVIKPQEKTVEPQTPPPSFDVFFPNDIWSGVGYPGATQAYESAKTGATQDDIIDYASLPDGKGFGIGTYKGELTKGSNGDYKVYTDNYNFGLNYKGKETQPFMVGDTEVFGASDNNLIPALQAYMAEKCTACVVKVSGYASAQGNLESNKQLAEKRAQTVITSLKTIFASLKQNQALTDDDINKRFTIGETKQLNSSGCNTKPDSPTDTLPCKKDRKVTVSFSVDPNLLPQNEIAPEPVEQKLIEKNISTKITNRFYSECSYFEKLTRENPFVFDEFRQKIKYFHPAFHSTTPEGFNSRLTFLQQCTRQGPTMNGNEQTNNLAFGRPPVCILRIGDFYNTKIIIESVSVSYEPLIWDLNPEGVGVQPMLANVDISFKFVGGSTLDGPINKLQNALSFNYYANSQVYDARADYISKERTVIKKTSEDGTVTETVAPVNDYYINNTINDLYGGNANLYNNTEQSQTTTTTSTNTAPPSIDQTKANENNSGPDTPQQSDVATGTTANDAQRIKLTDATQYASLETIDFTIDINGNTALSKSYKLVCTISSNDPNDTQVFSSSVLSDELNPVDLSQSFEVSWDKFSPPIVMELPSTFNVFTVRLLGTPHLYKTNLIFD
jgi:hypothetical protein